MKTYKELVLNTNKVLKEESTKLGYCIKVLKNFDQLPEELRPILERIETKKEYQKAVKNVRTSKAGKYTPFFLLQYLYKVHKNEAV